jgi:hypothetical protein
MRCVEKRESSKGTLEATPMRVYRPGSPHLDRKVKSPEENVSIVYLKIKA